MTLFPPPSSSSPNSSTADYHIYTDGGARGNPGPAATGFVIKDSKYEVVDEGGSFIGSTTNNEAEYRAVIYALTQLIKILPSSNTSPNLHLYLDSQLVVRQLEGKYKLKHPNLKTLATEVFALISQHKLVVTYHLIPREKNHEADAKVNQYLDAELL